MNKIYVGNLSYSISESDLEDRFSQYGSIVSVTLIKDRETGRLKGFGFIEFKTQEEAQAAVENEDGKDLLGRPLKVSLAREQRSQGGSGGGARRGGGSRQW